MHSNMPARLVAARFARLNAARVQSPATLSASAARLSLCARSARTLPTFASSSIRMSSTAAATQLNPQPAPLRVQPPTVEQEQADYDAAVKQVQEWFDSPRFKGIKRPYGPEAVVSKRGSMPVQPPASSLTADKLFALFSEHAAKGTPAHTMGAIDPIQQSQMAYNQEVVYVSAGHALPF